VLFQYSCHGAIRSEVADRLPVAFVREFRASDADGEAAPLLSGLDGDSDLAV
jgi:hypothetical protein